jgi:mRNA-degrading endonuclease toxin of MazEF toxin-antitoxin module
VVLDHRDGFPQICAINCDDLKTVQKTLLDRRLGRLSESKLDALEDALRFALQLR